MGFLHKDTAPEADLATTGIRCRAVVEQSDDMPGGLSMGGAMRGMFGGGMITEKGREKTLSGQQAFETKKVTVRIQPPGKDSYTVESKIGYPMMKAKWLYRGASFEVLVDPNNPQRFSVDWDGPHEDATAADLAAANPMIAASMKGAGIDVNAVTQMQLAARQAGQGTPNMIVGGQLVGPGMQPVHPAAAAPASNVDQLSKLAELHKSGALSDEEFAAEKAKLLNS